MIDDNPHTGWYSPLVIMGCSTSKTQHLKDFSGGHQPSLELVEHPVYPQVVGYIPYNPHDIPVISTLYMFIYYFPSVSRIISLMSRVAFISLCPDAATSSIFGNTSHWFIDSPWKYHKKPPEALVFDACVPFFLGWQTWWAPPWSHHSYHELHPGAGTAALRAACQGGRLHPPTLSTGAAAWCVAWWKRDGWGGEKRWWK